MKINPTDGTITRASDADGPTYLIVGDTGHAVKNDYDYGPVAFPFEDEAPTWGHITFSSRKVSR